MIELRHYRYVVAVAEALSFSAAARHLDVSTPTLSVQIRHVEDAIGTAIFWRTSQKVELTHVGMVFVAAAKQVLAVARDAELIGQQAMRGERGTIQLGYVGSAVYGGLLQRLIASFKTRYPLVSVQATEYPIDELPKRVESRDIDFAILRPPFKSGQGLVCIPLSDDHYGVALPDKHPLSSKSEMVQPADLCATAFVIPEQHESATWEVGKAGNFEPQIQSSQATLSAVLTQVSLGEVAAIVPRSVISNLIIPGVAYKELAGLEIKTGLVGLHRSSGLSVVVGHLVAIAAQMRHPMGGIGEHT
jgi:DNA-binding transcriptional LysR family regulator